MRPMAPRTPAILLAAALAVASCSVSVRQPSVHAPHLDTLAALIVRPGEQKNSQAFVKLHLKNGDLQIFTTWHLADSATIRGVGTRFDATREPSRAIRGEAAIPLDSVALVEADSPTSAFSIGNGLLNVWTVTWGAVTLSCVADPKSCFGSCPTFYVTGEDAQRPRAEGFSSSIARILEDTDLDDLQLTRAGGTAVEMEMRNEAWETHAVRWTRLRAVPRPLDADVAATADGRFHAVRDARAPARCRAAGGDCRAAVATRDALEWSDVTDEEDLARQDTVRLEFDSRESNPALLLSARQSFVSTYVLYQTMAWLGHDAGAWLARLERGDAAALRPLATVNRLIGTVVVEQEGEDGRWTVAARYDEAGPIAYDRRLVPLAARGDGAPLRVRLILAKGNWRVDQAALVALGERLDDHYLMPAVARLRNAAGERDVRATLTNDHEQLTTFPGDVVTLRYDLPRDAAQYALFLETRGHYYEMMRGEWLAEGNAEMASLLMNETRTALRRMAPLYKTREAYMEQNFWASRFGGTH